MTNFQDINTLGTIHMINRESVDITLKDKTPQTVVDNIPVYATNANDYVDPKDVETSVIGHCDLYDLTKSEDREKYADLMASLAATLNKEKIFEERIKTPDGGLCVYISYLEYVKIA